MGKSPGGLSTKIHAAVDGLGNPVRLLLTPGQASEYSQAEALIEGFAFEAALADKDYDSDAFVEVIQHRGAEAVIPSRKNRLSPLSLDRHLYKAATWWSVFPEAETVPPDSDTVRATGQPLPVDAVSCVGCHMPSLNENTP